MSLLIFQFWTATVFTFLKDGLQLLKVKALKLIPNMEELKHKVNLRKMERMIIFEIASHFN